MDFLDLPPIEHVSGVVRMPGSKSISNRVLLLAALAEGETIVRDVLQADDTSVMLAALRTLGISVNAVSGAEIRIEGCAGSIPVAAAKLFLGNAGTAFRPLTAVLAILGGDYELSGVPRMHERPIRDLVDALRAIGAHIDYLGNEGYPPLAIGRAQIRLVRPVRVRGDVSSQFLTALLMSLPLAGVAAVIEVEGELISRPYVEITLNLLRRFGVDIRRDDWSRFFVEGQSRYKAPGEIHIEGDASSASYFLAAGAIAGGPVRVEGIGGDSIQGDARFTRILESMGAAISVGPNWIESRNVGPLKAIDADFNDIPDAAMTAAMLALFADGPSTLRNIASWRVKETDRLYAMAKELRKLGAAVEEGADFLRISPPDTFQPATIDTYDDHRMAMCFALASLGGVPVRINDPDCVRKTFPEFFQELASITQSQWHFPL